MSIFQSFIKEWRTAHREWWNQNCSIPEFKVGDAVKSHVQVHSKSDTGEVSKLMNRNFGPFQIKTVLGNNIYEVHQYNYLTYGIHKLKGSEIYVLPPVIFLHKPIDTVDTKFLNYSNAPIVSSLQKYLNIQLYNNHFFKPRSLSIL